MVFSRMTLVSIAPVLATILLMGLFSDSVKPVLLIAPGFLLRSLICFGFKYVDDPTSNMALTCSSMLLVASTMLIISLESLFMKNLPREVRGAMTILLTFFMGCAALLFHGVGGPIFDALGPASPFVLVSVFDVALCAFAIVLGALGMLTYPQLESAEAQHAQSIEARANNDNSQISAKDEDIDAVKGDTENALLNNSSTMQ